MNKTGAERKAKIFIWSVSVLLPIALAGLRFVPKIDADGGTLREVLNRLPLFNAICNGTTAILLIIAFLSILRKNIRLHRRLMTACLMLSGLFLLSYTTYHATTAHTVFPVESPLWNTYQIILWTHIALSVVVVPMVLVTYSRALAEKFDKHRRIARITLPIWLYVAFTGVAVYILISPFYPF
ncbi:MAG: DUF420 domain-containing protein [Crocinitomicaceae bacterium]|nr:DUF420 domain-containing protein [Crocinitomicaceae bacterium]